MDALRQILKPKPSPGNPFRTSTNPFRHTSTASTASTTHPTPSSKTPTTSTQVTLLELFQSQGCDSCPPANSFLITHYTPSPSSPSNNNKTLLLTYEVTYWDRLGWADTFGDARWDARQRDYASVLGQRSVYTPQVLVDGGSVPLNSWRDLGRVLPQYQARSAMEGKVEIEGFRKEGGWEVDVGAYRGEGEVLAVWYEELPDDVRITRGENRGVTLPHRNIVRDLAVLGSCGRGEKFEVRERRGLKLVVLVQEGRGGRILGAACL